MPGILETDFHTYLPTISEDVMLAAIRAQKLAVSVNAQKIPNGLIVAFGTKNGPTEALILTPLVIQHLRAFLDDQNAPPT